MDKLTSHKNVAKAIIQEIRQMIPNQDDLEIQVITDDIHGHYLLKMVGWENGICIDCTESVGLCFVKETSDALLMCMYLHKVHMLPPACILHSISHHMIDCPVPTCLVTIMLMMLQKSHCVKSHLSSHTKAFEYTKKINVES